MVTTVRVKPTPTVAAIAHLLTGRFDNSAQAIVDPEFFLVHYNNCVIDVIDPPFAPDAVVIFAEQTSEHFIRRRLMVIQPAPDDQIEVAFYQLRQDSQFARLGDRPRTAHVMHASDIGSPECSLFFTVQGEMFVGGTLPQGCAHSYGGGDRLHIDAVLSAQALSVWERWYDGDHQVAGPTKGPYRYQPAISCPLEQTPTTPHSCNSVSPWVSVRH